MSRLAPNRIVVNRIANRIATIMALLGLLNFAPWAEAAAPSMPAAQQAEVRQLLQRLRQSPCRFYRNGSWYSAAEAAAHLDKKYQYLLDKQLIHSSEEFISRGASKSSISGEAYQVQCPTQPQEPSAHWLHQQLQQLRTPAAARS